ncbi:MAG: hypothetical protein Q8O76_07225 [Chloroflexota bacterium]|nr:hypothetical protein [Chloroflexota bacterium]
MVAKTIVVLDPTARAQVTESPMALRLESLVGKKVGFLDNSKPNADILIARIKARLEERFEFGGTVERRKHNAASGMREGVLEELASCDFVINGVGD